MSITRRPVDNIETKASSYDRLSAGLTAMILLVGFFVATLFLIWLTSIVKFDSNVATPFQAADIGNNGNDKPEGFEDDELDPGVEEFAEVDTPQLAEALESVSNAVSTIRASSEHVSGDAAAMGKGGGYGSRRGGPSGTTDGVPAHERWKIVYEVDNQQTYKEQLDYFNIHLGVIEPVGKRVFRVSNLSKGARAVQTSRETERKSLFFSHSKLRMKRWDEEFCRGAGVNTAGNLLVQFFDGNTKNLIAKAEDDYLKSVGRELKDVRRTNIKVVPQGSGFEFVIEDCQYL